MYKIGERKAQDAETNARGSMATSDPAAVRAEALRSLIAEAQSRAVTPQPAPALTKLEAGNRRRLGGRTLAEIIASATGLPGPRPTGMLPQPGAKAPRPL